MMGSIISFSVTHLINICVYNISISMMGNIISFYMYKILISYICASIYTYMIRVYNISICMMGSIISFSVTHLININGRWWSFSVTHLILRHSSHQHQWWMR